MTGPQAARQLHGSHQQVENGTSDGKGKGRLKVIGKEFPDIDDEHQFEANWKISKGREVLSAVESQEDRKRITPQNIHLDRLVSLLMFCRSLPRSDHML